MSNDPFDISANAALVGRRKVQVEPMRTNPSHQNAVDQEDTELPDSTIDAITTTPETKIINGHEVKIRSRSPEEIAKGPMGLWTPDKAAESGQIRAGDVDDAQSAFLKQTEMITTEDGNDDTEFLKKKGMI